MKRPRSGDDDDDALDPYGPSNVNRRALGQLADAAAHIVARLATR